MSKFEVPETINTTIYVYMHTEGYFSGCLTFFDRDLNSHDDLIYLGKTEISLDVGKVDINNKVIESLKDKKQSILAKAQVEANQIDEQIQSLLAIEFKGEE